MHRALDFLSACHGLRLPINVERIAAQKRYVVRYYSKSRSLLHTLGLTELTASRPAISLQLNDIYHIFLSDSLNVQATAHAIAHEIGHIALEHLRPGQTEHDDRQEEQAETFALYLLAPPPILEKYHVRSAEDIRACTGLSLDDSRRAYRFLEEYRQRQADTRLYEGLARRVHRFSRLRLLHTSILLAAILVLAISVLLLQGVGEAAGLSQEETGAAAAAATYRTGAPADLYWADDSYCCHLYIDCQELQDHETVHKGYASAKMTGICCHCCLRYIREHPISE